MGPLNDTSIIRRYARHLTLVLIAFAWTCAPKDPTPAPSGDIDASISGFSPTSGETGTIVTITGSFPSTAAITVNFNGVGATINSKSATELVVSVPDAALSSLISVVVDGDTIQTTTAFNVKPNITSLNVYMGPPGTAVIVNGTGFDPASLTVHFNGTASINSNVTPTSFHTTVPANSTSGLVSVSVGNLSAVSSEFTVVNSKAIVNGGPFWDEGTAIVVDQLGNVFVAGTFTQEATIGGQALTDNNGEIFITKYNSMLQPVWVRQAGSNSDEVGALVLDDAGNLYLGGRTGRNGKFGSFTASSILSPKIFVAKMDAGGNFLWLTTGETSNTPYLNDIHIDDSGTLHATGRFGGTLMLDGLPTLNASLSGYDMFVARLNTSDGAATFSVNLGGNATENPMSIAVDGSGHIYIAGNFFGTMTLGSTTITSGLHHEDGFVAKLTGSGALQWVKHLSGSSYQDSFASVRLDALGKVYVAGTYTQTAGFAGQSLSATAGGIIVARLDAASGAIDWRLDVDGTSWDQVNDLSVKNDGTCFLTGSFQTNLKIGDKNISAAGTNDEIFVAKISAEGHPVWLTQGGSLQSDSPFGIAINGQVIALTGFVSHNPSFWDTQPIHIGSSDLFVWRIEVK